MTSGLLVVAPDGESVTSSYPFDIFSFFGPPGISYTICGNYVCGYEIGSNGTVSVYSYGLVQANTDTNLLTTWLPDHPVLGGDGGPFSSGPTKYQMVSFGTKLVIPYVHDDDASTKEFFVYDVVSGEQTHVPLDEFDQLTGSSVSGGGLFSTGFFLDQGAETALHFYNPLTGGLRLYDALDSAANVVPDPAMPPDPDNGSLVAADFDPTGLAYIPVWSGIMVVPTAVQDSDPYDPGGTVHSSGTIFAVKDDDPFPDTYTFQKTGPDSDQTYFVAGTGWRRASYEIKLADTLDADVDNLRIYCYDSQNFVANLITLDIEPGSAGTTLTGRLFPDDSITYTNTYYSEAAGYAYTHNTGPPQPGVNVEVRDGQEHIEGDNIAYAKMSGSSDTTTPAMYHNHVPNYRFKHRASTALNDEFTSTEDQYQWGAGSREWSWAHVGSGLWSSIMAAESTTGGSVRYTIALHYEPVIVVPLTGYVLGARRTFVSA